MKTRIKPLKKGEGGFTLVETLLTLSILAVILVILFSSLRLGISSWEKGEARAEEAAEARMLASRLAVDIGSMYPYRKKGEAGEEYLFVGSGNALGFVTVSRAGGLGKRGTPWGGAKWVYYSVGEKGLTIREKPFLSEDVESDEGGRLIELGPGVREMRLEYMGEGGWEESWDADGKKSLPSAVRVHVLLNGREAEKGFLFAVPVGNSSGSQASVTAGFKTIIP